MLSEEELGTTITIPPVTDTSLIDPDVLQNVLSAALSHGGDMAEVFAEDSTTASAICESTSARLANSRGRDVVIPASASVPGVVRPPGWRPSWRGG